MNKAEDILSYAQTHGINLVAENGHLKIDAPETALTDNFLSSAKLYKFEIIRALTKRWDPEQAANGYVWCLDCQHFDSVNCNHYDNPFRTVTKCPQAPRKCQWFNKCEVME